VSFDYGKERDGSLFPGGKKEQGLAREILGGEREVPLGGGGGGPALNAGGNKTEISCTGIITDQGPSEKASIAHKKKKKEGGKRERILAWEGKREGGKETLSHRFRAGGGKKKPLLIKAREQETFLRRGGKTQEDLFFSLTKTTPKKKSRSMRKKKDRRALLVRGRGGRGPLGPE